ncbi:LAMI_0H02256g1_1 [Lachancea mirantina]|uniref:LAMI_0H02256g1_1 n=1 Tax=Lachancea mirantina TaxID=1230905 RepID=A0A1G4KDX1_9SACH|nr:LAMI_0H02256g1_1 [Lachancea mirantina]
MGYVTPGYATRRRKRQKTALKVYYENVNVSENLNAARGASRGAKLTLERLPVDILQHIFVLSGTNNAMPLVNKKFHAVLRANAYLARRYVLENYVWAVENQYVLATEAFDVPALMTFFVDNSEFLDLIDGVKSVDAIITTKDNSTKLLDFPNAFYRHPELLFYNDITGKRVVYSQLLLKLNAFFEIEHPSSLCETVVHWFFWKNDLENYNINHMFYAVKLVLHLSRLRNSTLDDVGPLTEFIINMYMDVTPRLLTLLLCEKLEDAHLISERKARIVDKFVRKFYRGDVSSLSHDSLWRTVSEIKDFELIEVMVRHGGAPSFDVVN